MRKIIAILMAFVIISALFAAGSSESTTATSDKPTIRLLTDQSGVDDKSFNAAAWRGILSYYGDTWETQNGRGSLYDVVTAQTQDMYIPNLKQAADEGYDIIAVTGFTFADALAEVAPLYPDQKFMIVDVDWLSGDNLLQFAFAEQEGSFLVGVAAALKSIEDGIKNPKFGFIGGIASPTITKFEIGFIQGVKSVIADAEFVDYYANDWGKPELAKATAKNWFDNGVYAIFSAAGGTGNGTIAQAKEYQMQGKNVWAIGVDSDQYDEGIWADGKSAVLTSMIKRVEACTEYALTAVATGSFKGQVLVMDAKANAVGYSSKNLSESVITSVEAVKKDIINGKIKLYATYAAAKSAGAVPGNLLAVD